VQDLGIYVHLPFCPHVCPYCDFAVEATGPELPAKLATRYVELLLRELELSLDHFGDRLRGRPLDSLYLGGGTPSLLPPDALRCLLDGVRAHFGSAPRETTLEVNPGRSDTRPARAWRALGIDRLSIGLQALDDRALRRLGRAHSADEAREGLLECLRAGFENVSVDLIYGIPGQSEAQLLAGAREVVELGIPHVSTYALTLEPDTPFGRAAARGDFAEVDAGLVRRQGRHLRALLSASGIAPYEISSAARAGFESRHNTRYWTRRCVLGLGVSAASLVCEQRFQNPRDRAQWSRALEQGQLAFGVPESLGPLEQRRETLALGLRRWIGVSLAEYRARFGAPPQADFAAELRELVEFELIELIGGYLRLTDRGRQFADDVFMRFVAEAPTAECCVRT